MKYRIQVRHCISHISMYIWIYIGECLCLCVCLYVCLCVCVYVCLSVCPAIRFHISQRIFSKFGGNILWVMTHIVGYLLLCARNARACACVLNVRACVYSLIFERILCIFAGNILRLTIRFKDYVRFMYTHRAHTWERACAWLSIRLSMDRMSSNLRWTYYESQHVAWTIYFSCSLTARTRASERVRARAWLKHTLIG
jgi:hypothetical protein